MNRDRGRSSSFFALATPVARSRLTHFLVIGAALFALAPSPARGRSVHIDPGDLAAQRAEERRRLGVSALSDAEARAVEARAVEDEILYREALRLGLDHGDSIVRRRLVQKVLFLAEDLGGASREPREADLRAYFEATRERSPSRTASRSRSRRSASSPSLLSPPKRASR
jgi:hypothetical protein